MNDIQTSRQISPELSPVSHQLHSGQADLEAFAVIGLLPEVVIAIGNLAQAVEAVASCRSHGLSIVPCGGMTHLHEGNPLRTGRWAAISTTGLCNEFDFSPADMVVTAGTGMTLAKLQARLAEQNQYVPIDAPRPDEATLGGIVATNSTGLWRPAFGTPRDRLLGLRAVLSDGSVIKGGGRVVKNVAGYDICKLFAGSWGTLGLITEVTFKTNPLPEARSHFAFSFRSPEEGLNAALDIHTAMLQPLYLTAIVPEQQLIIGLSGSKQAVRWQEDEITKVAKQNGIARAEPVLLEGELRNRIPSSDCEVRLRIAVRPTDLCPTAGKVILAIENCSPILAVSFPTGILEVGFSPKADARESDTQRIVASIRNAVPIGGHLVWTRVADAWRPHVGDVWGHTRGDFKLMAGIKKALDPEDAFSPGRFVGRL